MAGSAWTGGHHRLPARARAGPGRRSGQAGASGVPVLQGHPRQHRRQVVGKGLAHADRRPDRRRLGLSGLLWASPAGDASARPSDPGVVSYAVLRQGVGGQHRRRDRCGRVAVHRAGPGVLRRQPGVQQLGRHRVAGGLQRSRSGVVQRRHRADLADRQTHLVKQAVGVFATNDAADRRIPPGHGPHGRLLGPDHRHASGQRHDPGVVVRRRPGRPRPTRRGSSRRPAPTGDVSPRPGCGKTFCCRPKSASPATVDRR